MYGVFLPLALLRLIGGLGLLVGVGVFGYYGRPLWVLPVLAGIFTISFGLGKWRAWAHAAQNGTFGKSFIGQAGTYVVQLILVTILYFVGRGVGSMAGVDTVAATLAQIDWVWLGWFAAFALAVGLGIIGLDLLARARIEAPVLPTSAAYKPDAPQIDPTPLTPATFWNRHHYSNKDHLYDDDRETVLNEARAFLDDAAIAAEEARLGVALPATLRALFALQNGGSAMSLYVPCDKPMNNVEGGWINPFSGYNDMTPLNRVTTLHESISAYADEDEQPEMFPTNSQKIIVLAQWYRETLFLDCRGRETPRVGFVDFDQYEDLSSETWEDEALCWDDFEMFFEQLRAEADR